MKLTHFALAAVMVLLLAAGYLTIKSDFEGQMAAQRDEARMMNEKLIEKIDQLNGKGEPVPAPAAGSPEATAPAVSGPPDLPPVASDDSEIRNREEALLRSATGGSLPDAEAEESNGQALSPVQLAIVKLPAIARVKGYSRELEAVVLDRGERVNLRKGDEFSLRRKTFVIGKVRIGDTVDMDECVADIIPGTLQPGMEPEPGDEAIQFE